ncbi:MAG: DUF2332 family protein [Deltaproteobacteria bacterium]|nr:DUF2332 family protein [Deltaproteobacteria bacterium]
MAAAPVDPAVLDAFELQVPACRDGGSEFTARILERCIEDLHAGGPVARLVADYEGNPFLDAICQRVVGAVQGLVLEGKAPELSRLHPFAGGTPKWPDVADAFVAAIESHLAELRPRMKRQVQTNEVRRCCGLLGGFLSSGRTVGAIPLRSRFSRASGRAPRRPSTPRSAWPHAAAATSTRSTPPTPRRCASSRASTGPTSSIGCSCCSRLRRRCQGPHRSKRFTAATSSSVKWPSCPKASPPCSITRPCGGTCHATSRSGSPQRWRRRARAPPPSGRSHGCAANRRRSTTSRSACASGRAAKTGSWAARSTTAAGSNGSRDRLPHSKKEVGSWLKDRSETCVWWRWRTSSRCQPPARCWPTWAPR